MPVAKAAVAEGEVALATEDLTGPDVLLASEHVMGNGVREDLQDCVYLRPQAFETRHTRRIADEHMIDYDTAYHLTKVYGVRAPRLAEMIDADESLGEVMLIVPSLSRSATISRPPPLPATMLIVPPASLTSVSPLTTSFAV